MLLGTTIYRKNPYDSGTNHLITLRNRINLEVPIFMVSAPSELMAIECLYKNIMSTQITMIDLYGFGNYCTVIVGEADTLEDCIKFENGRYSLCVSVATLNSIDELSLDEVVRIFPGAVK